MQKVKYCEIEQLKRDITEAYKGKNEFMAAAICSIIDKRAIEATMKSGNKCDYCVKQGGTLADCFPKYGMKECKFEGKKIIEVAE